MIVPRFASTHLAPLRLPRAFEQSLWSWPAIAHEIAHDFYYSLRGLEPSLRARLGLPSKVEMPMSSAELDGPWLRNVFGAWLPEVVADTLGTMSLGPAYVETMLRAFRNPSSPQRTAAILQDRSLIDEHPPPRLRLYMATRVLHHLGRHEEADALGHGGKRTTPKLVSTSCPSVDNGLVFRTKHYTPLRIRSSTPWCNAPGPSSKAST